MHATSIITRPITTTTTTTTNHHHHHHDQLPPPPRPITTTTTTNYHHHDLSHTRARLHAHNLYSLLCCSLLSTPPLFSLGTLTHAPWFLTTRRDYKLEPQLSECLVTLEREEMQRVYAECKRLGFTDEGKNRCVLVWIQALALALASECVFCFS